MRSQYSGSKKRNGGGKQSFHPPFMSEMIRLNLQVEVFPATPTACTERTCTESPASPALATTPALHCCIASFIMSSFGAGFGGGGSDGGSACGFDDLCSGDGNGSDGECGGVSADGGMRTVESMLSDVRGLCLRNEEYQKAVLKLLRVGSAQNAPLELKLEIAAVRLLQFGLIAAKFRQVVAHAVDVSEHAALRAMKEGEPAEEDCGAENGNTDFCHTAVQRESHALILARIPNEARCKAKIAD
jgi:hypothetical protein